MSNQRAPLRRSRHNRMIAGVCGGLSEFFGISAFWFRLAFLIALIPGGIPGLGAYLLMWIIVPKARY
jgi:phage shock protein C